MEQVITVTRRDLERAIEQWERNVRNDRSAFKTAEQTAEMSVEDHARASVDYLLEMIAEVQRV